MNIRQLQIGYNIDNDRLLVRVNSTDGSEIRFWLTRRLVSRLWPTLLKTSEAVTLAALGRGADVMGEARGMMTGMARESALAQSDFDTPFDSQASKLPLGAEPLLITRVDLAPQDKGSLRIAFRHSEQVGVEMNMNHKVLHAFCNLMQREVEKADWGFRLDWNQPVEAGARPATLN